MLSLLIRNMLWAAWWPYYTMLLTMEKAAQQRDRAAAQPQSQPPAPPAEDRGQGVRQESPMASDASLKPEVPEALRELMRMSIDQARRAFADRLEVGIALLQPCHEIPL